jgi:hypothetical protein
VVERVVLEMTGEPCLVGMQSDPLAQDLPDASRRAVRGGTCLLGRAHLEDWRHM